MRIHLIAIGGAVMHNLALELEAYGHEVSGSDDEIYDPAYSRLKDKNLLPGSMGWDETRITKDVDLIILGMHAHSDNPELLRAIDLGLTVQSFPEYVANHICNKAKIVVCGSHGKTTTTAMIMHVLQRLHVNFDYLVGGLVRGFDRMVRLSADAGIAVIEGDEYLSSRIDKRPKMLLYDGNVIIITGIAWDHMNVFPTLENYEEQFFALIANKGNLKKLLWYEEDDRLAELVSRAGVKMALPYGPLSSHMAGTVTYNDADYPVSIFGKHNLSNMQAALMACAEIGIQPGQFLKEIADFRGVGCRLEQIHDDPPVYRDFAHAPSKVKATVDAVRSKYPDKKILAIAELHTYSSLNKLFLPQYRDTLDGADQAIVFYDPHTIAIKRLAPLHKDFVKDIFNHRNLTVTDSAAQFRKCVKQAIGQNEVILVMSSGNLGGMKPEDFIP